MQAETFITALLNNSPLFAVVCFMFWNMREDKQKLIDIVTKYSEILEGLKSSIDKMSDRLDRR